VEALAAALSGSEETVMFIFAPARPFIQSPPTALQILIDDSYPGTQANIYSPVLQTGQLLHNAS